MYSLTICFGPTAMVWAFLFKEKEKAEASLALVNNWAEANSKMVHFTIVDDFGQEAFFIYKAVHGAILEDLDLTDEAKIIRSLANARNEVKARKRAATDPVIREGMNQQGPSVISPFPRG